MTAYQTRKVVRLRCLAGIPSRTIRAWNLDNPEMSDDARAVMINQAMRNRTAQFKGKKLKERGKSDKATIKAYRAQF